MLLENVAKFISSYYKYCMTIYLSKLQVKAIYQNKMAMHKSEKYSRIMYLLSYGYTKLTQSYIMKQVKDTTPSGHNPSPWTLDDFLNHNKTYIDNTYFGSRRETQRILFPPSGRATDIESWDLQLLCFIFLELCNPSFIVQMDYRHFKAMRNSLCHTAPDDISDSEYCACFVQLTFGIRRCLTNIMDPDLADKMEGTIKAVGTDTTMQIERFVETELKNWYNAERATLERVETGVGRVVEGMNHTTEGLKRLSWRHMAVLSSLHEIKSLLQGHGININVPETKLTVSVKNCDSDNETFICGKIIEYLGPRIQHLEDEKQAEIQEAVKKSMKELLGNDLEFQKAEQKCIILHLKARHIESLITLWQACIDEKITAISKPVEMAVQTLQGFEKVKIEVLLPDKEFWCCTEILAQLKHIENVCENEKLNHHLQQLSKVLKSAYNMSHLDIEAKLVPDQKESNTRCSMFKPKMELLYMDSMLTDYVWGPTLTDYPVCGHQHDFLPRPKSPQPRTTYKEYDTRVASFTNWPSHIVQTPQQLAEAGFYYKGEKDHVRCFACNIALCRWETEDDPWFEHARWSSRCVYVKREKGQDFIDNVKETLDSWRTDSSDSTTKVDTVTHIFSSKINLQSDQTDLLFSNEQMRPHRRALSLTPPLLSSSPVDNIHETGLKQYDIQFSDRDSGSESDFEVSSTNPLQVSRSSSRSSLPLKSNKDKEYESGSTSDVYD